MVLASQAPSPAVVYQEALEALRSPAIIEAARRDPAIFAAYVLRDESTQGHVVMDPPHIDMQDTITRHPRCMFLAPQRSGKSQQLYARMLWELGHDHTHRMILACATHQNAVDAVTLLGRYIRSSEELHAVFPDLVPANPWGETKLTVRRPGGIRDATVRAAGVGTEITGARCTWALLDDAITPDNTATPKSRQRTVEWYNTNLLGRLEPDARVVGVANALHPDDAFHRFAKSKDVWVMREYPVFREDGSLGFPHRWPREAIAKRKAELDLSSPYDYDRFMLCRLRRDEDASPIKQAWIDFCLARGLGLALIPRLDAIPDRATVWHGMDLGFSKKGDLSALVTVLRYPNGFVLPLSVESGHWELAEKRRRIIMAHARYGGFVIVESVGAQQTLVEHLNEDHPEIPVRGFNTTAKSKRDALDRLCALLAMGQLPLPNEAGKLDPELQALVDDMLYLDVAGHWGDRLMSLLFALHGAQTMSGELPEVGVSLA